MAVALTRMPKVSVIIPNFNHAKFLRARLESVFSQTFQDLEVIFLDDASTDDSRAVFEKVSEPHKDRVAAVFNETNSGNPFKQWNKGLAIAKGEYVWIAESDDYAHHDFLSSLVNVLDQHSDVGLAYCRSQFIDESGNPQEWSPGTRWEIDFINDGRDECVNHLVTQNSIPNASAVLFRKQLAEQVGLADESLRFCGDWMMWVRILLVSNVAYIARPLNYYRKHGLSVSSRVAPTWIYPEESYRIAHSLSRALRLTQSDIERPSEVLLTNWLRVASSGITWQDSLRVYKTARRFDRKLRQRLVKRGLRSALDHMRLRSTVSHLYHLVRE